MTAALTRPRVRTEAASDLPRRFSFTEFVLTITALAGVTSLLWLAAAQLFSLSMVDFRTGSMSPSMPAGTLAIAMEVEAEEIRGGDVVTVRRLGELPITHRVVSTDDAGPGVRSLILKGDDNAEADASPYVVSEALRVGAWIPGASRYWDVLRSPGSIGLAIIGVGVVLTVALLPRRQRKRRRA